MSTSELEAERRGVKVGMVGLDLRRGEMGFEGKEAACWGLVGGGRSRILGSRREKVVDILGFEANLRDLFNEEEEEEMGGVMCGEKYM